MFITGGAGASVADLVRLNYAISDAMNGELVGYCEITGRSASDVIRQLICEVLEEDRVLPPPTAIIALDRSGARRERRTDMWVPLKTLAAFDEKVETEGYPGKSAVIAYLLGDFLRGRGAIGEDLVKTTIVVDRETYARFATLAVANGKSPEQAIADVCSDYARKNKNK